jgi:hypothetical protein
MQYWPALENLGLIGTPCSPYESGDLAGLVRGPCSVGRTGGIISGIRGRRVRGHA